jgi:dihydrofolate synthase/folylpolyglutamate synthase
MDRRYPEQAEREPLAWLFSFPDWERGVAPSERGTPAAGWQLGRTRALLDLAGAPDRGLPVVTVAGTNGKGSTAAILEAIARATGLRTGVYSQPHLHSYRERIRIDGRPIAAGPFANGVDRLRDLSAQLARAHPDAGTPTTFELTTALAVLAFADAAVDLAVLEVGLGGRLDAVNAIDPSLAIVTSIGYDHRAILGRTLSAIATEKAGIFRRDRLALSAEQRPVTAAALTRAARSAGTRLRFVPPLLPGQAGTAICPSHGQMVRLPGDSADASTRLGLPGSHQRQNAALAIAAAEAIGQTIRPIGLEAMRAGLADVHWPGRLEWIDRERPMLLDGAHNPPGAAALARALDEVAPGRPIELIFGCAQDKEASAMLRALLPRAIRTRFVAAGDPRAAEPATLAALARRLGAEAGAVDTAGSVAEAIDLAIQRGSSADALLVVTGSLRVVAEARVALGLASK